MRQWIARGRIVADQTRPRVMGIVNVTPDSFSDGGALFELDAAIGHCLKLEAEGAEILDIGGESSRPGSEPVTLEDELRRVVPLVAKVRSKTQTTLSVDTMKPAVARACLQEGVDIINDITGLADPQMIEVAAEFGAGVVLMHMKGLPKSMQDAPSYDDVVKEVSDFLAERIDRAIAGGIRRDQIAIDPGIGFGKTIEHNLSLLRNLRHFDSLGCTILVGTSRKRFLGTLTGREVSDRVVGSVVSSLLAIQGGADVVRVHDVSPMVDAVKVYAALQTRS
jgi:dihydropteroate synthase